jgi:GNAT superfamily N-acetyltransferase
LISPTITAVRGGADLADVARLFQAYAASLSIDLSRQSFDQELAALPGPYRPPLGELLLARDAGGAPVGCVAVKPLDDDGVCEIKRLYVAPAGRGAGVGQALVAAIITAAEGAGHRQIKLDTLAEMTAARALYGRFGFAEIPNYGTFPYPGLICLGRRLDG